MRESKGRAVVVGGSIAGVCTAHALLLAGWQVVVLEKTTAPPTGSPTGAGVGLDPLSLSIINSWLPQNQSVNLLNNLTLPLTIDQNQTTDAEKKITRMLTRDESFNFRAACWSDLHSLLYNALPPDIFLWGHIFLSFRTSDDKKSVVVQSKILQTGNMVEILGDLLVAADGSMSSIRQTFLPDLKLRYSGYCAWRGVLDLSSNKNSEIIVALQKVYSDIGKCLYFDLGSGTHSVFYELLNRRINWIWYVNQPEPQLKGVSESEEADVVLNVVSESYLVVCFFKERRHNKRFLPLNEKNKQIRKALKTSDSVKHKRIFRSSSQKQTSP